MVEIISIIIFFVSFLGLIIIIFQKLPILSILPEKTKQRESIIFRIKEKLKKINPFRNFSYEIFLQKILTKIRILSLKTDNKIFNWLQKLREDYKKKKMKKIENEKFWEEIKKIKNQK